MARVPLKSKSRIGEITKAFNSMAEKLETANRELQKAKKQAEETTKLKDKNPRCKQRGIKGKARNRRKRRGIKPKLRNKFVSIVAVRKTRKRSFRLQAWKGSGQRPEPTVFLL